MHKNPFSKRKEYFDLSNLGLKDKDLKAFFKTRVIPETVRVLDLSRNKLTGKSVDTILENIPLGINLVTLDDNPGFTDKDTQKLTRGIVMFRQQVELED